MIRLTGRGVIYGELWYDEPAPSAPGVDILQYRQSPVLIAQIGHTPFLSLVSELTPAPDAIIDKFGKDCRYKIRRAQSRDGLQIESIAEPHARLDEFADFFDVFATEKSVALCDRNWLVAACNARQLALSSVSRDGEALVWHAHVLSGMTAGLQYSASRFRDRDSDYRALVGRANRWLHWHDMLHFKQTGKDHYDWGGIFADESAPDRAGINNFKRDFGGQQVRSFQFDVPLTIRGRVWLPLRQAWLRARSLDGGSRAGVRAIDAAAGQATQNDAVPGRQAYATGEGSIV